MAWNSFCALPCRNKKKKLDSSRLDVVEIARVPDMLPSLFPFLVGLRTYQHPGTMSGDSLVDVVTGQQAGPSCLLCWQRQEIFVFSRTSTQPLVQQLHAALNLGVKLPDRETDQSPSSSAQKTLPNVTKTWRSIKHGDEFQLLTFLLKFEWALCY